jgi:hypothetical protein
MARRVYFGFDYDRDVSRANVVRNIWVTKPDRQAAGFFDVAEREKVKKGGYIAIKRWIDEQLKGTSVTVVLIGAKTYASFWVKYEIIKSYEKGNGILGIYINKIKDLKGRPDFKGRNPLDIIKVPVKKNSVTVRMIPLPNIYPTYDWLDDNGYENIGDWIEIEAP